MFEPMDADATTKQAAIDWLLAVGECNTPSESTGSALATLRFRGVDYARSDVPQYLITEIDNDEIGRPHDRVAMLTATIIFADAVAPVDRYGTFDGVEFVVPPAAFAHQVMGLAIGAVGPGTDYRGHWETRMHVGAYDRLVRTAREDQERERARQAALAAREEYADLLGKIVRDIEGDPADPASYGIVRSVSDQGRTYGVVWHGDVKAHGASYHEIEFVDPADVPQSFTRQ